MYAVYYNSMRFPRFIKLPEYKKFNYSPLYYNKTKENIETKLKSAKEKKEKLESHVFEPDIKGKIKNRFNRNITEQQKKTEKLRLGLIIVFLIVLLYYIFEKGDIIEKFINTLFSGKN
jgi:hypothetical protein